MAEITIVDQTNKSVGTRELNPAVFELDADAGFVHRVYSALALSQRGGTRSVKTRADVSGGGRKPFKQKGTGRARQGTTRASQMRHGGVAHGPSATSEFTTRINKKERRHALRLVLSECVRQGKLTVVDKLEFEAPRTKDFVQMLDAMNTVSGLVVLAEENNQIELSGRNVPNSKVIQDGQVNIHDLLKSKRVIITEAAFEKLEGRLS